MNEYQIHKLLTEAKQFEQRRMWLHAIQIYQKLLEKFPEQLEFRTRLGLTYLHLGNLKASEQILLQALKNEPENTEILYALGAICYQSNEYDRALSYLELLIPTSDSKTHYSLGLVQWKRDKLQEAERHFELALRYNAVDIDAALALGETRMRNEQYEAAAWAFQRAISIQDDSVTALSGLGIAYLKCEQWKKAMIAFERALLIEPGKTELLLPLAIAMTHNGSLDEAEHVFKGILEKQTTYEPALIGLGRIAMLKSNHDRARKYFNQVLDLNPENEEALELLHYIVPNGKSIQ